MKQTIKTIAAIFITLLILSSCTKTYLFPHIVVVEAEDGVKYSISHPTAIKYKKVDYMNSQILEGKDFLYNTISGFSSGNRSIAEEVEYTITAENNSNRESSITMYFITTPYDIPFKGPDTELTNEIMEWVRENHAAMCTLTKDEQSKSILVEL